MWANGASSTCITEAPRQGVSIELQSHDENNPSKNAPTYPGRVLGSGQYGNTEEVHSSEQDDRAESLPSPTTNLEHGQTKWYTPRINMYRTLSTFWSLFIMGMNDATYGVSGHNNFEACTTG